MSNEQTFPPPPEPTAPIAAPEAQNFGGYPPAPQAQPYPGYPPYPPQQQTYQPGVWAGQPQYMPMPPAPKPPSPLTDPKALTEKLDLIALVVLGGFAFAGLLELVASFVGTPFGGGGYYVTTGIGEFIAKCLYGVVGFSVLMSLKHVIDLKHAKAEAAAKAEAEAKEKEEEKAE